MISIDSVEQSLESLNIRFIRRDDSLHLRWQTEHFDDLRVKILTNETQSWLYIIARFSDFMEIPESLKYDFAMEMLRASWKFNGIKFAISPENDVIVMAQTNDIELNDTELRTLLDNVILGCEVLWNISSSLGSPSSSKHNTDSKNDD